MRIQSLVLSFAIALLCSRAAFADSITYSFAGDGLTAALSGSFVLDDTAAWRILGSPDPSEAILSSPIQQIWGTFGEYEFQGVASLHVLDQPAYRSDGSETFAPDYWIIRAPLTGTVLNGVAPMWLNLFVYTSAGTLDGLELTPPPHDADPHHFQFTLSFGKTDGEFDSFTGGQLAGLERVQEVGTSSPIAVVPEPGTLLLLALGSVVAGRARRRVDR